MANTSNLLRKQVASEMRKRRLIFYTVILLSFIYLFVSIVFGESGFLRYKKLQHTKVQLESQIKEIQEDNQLLKKQLRLLHEEPFYQEKHAREDFGLAKPDEYIFQYDR